MDFSEYEKSGQAQYAKLSSTVAGILTVVVRDLPSVRVQQIQHRSKSPSSLRKKIEDRGGLLTDHVETHAKDVAGCRIIFYTNDDLSAFIKSRVMWDNFDIDWDRTKFHYPLDETSGEGLFISYNYVVKLKDQRTTLPEYADLQGLWCEIQVQTTLDHAWSEMHHDTVYKPPAGGFGSVVLKDVKARMSKIMQEHLLPAGFDFQKVSNDVRRLETARAFYESGPLALIQSDIDNNERHGLIERYGELVMPYLDDLDEQAATIRDCIAGALAKAAMTPEKPVVLGPHEYPGKSLDDIVDACLNVVDRLRYRDQQGVAETWRIAGEAFDLAATEKGQARAIQSVKTLAENNLHVWKQAGPWAQCQVAALLEAELDKPERRRMLVAAAEAILSPEVTGTTSGSATITLHQGAVIPSDDLASARGQAIAALETLLFTPNASDQKVVFDALLKAASFPYTSNYDHRLVRLVDNDTLRIVDIATRLVPIVDRFLRGSIEHRMLRLYRHGGGLTEKDEENADLVALRNQLRAALEAFRDRVNDDPAYTIHKMLVGFETVSRADWDRAEFDFEASATERKEAIAALVDSLTDATFEDLVPTLLDVVQVRSSDGATFVSFHEFLVGLGRDKPALALKLIAGRVDDLEAFLSPLLDGLSESARADDGADLCRKWIERGAHLRQILFHCSRTRRFDFSLFEAAVQAVMAGQDEQAVLILVDLASRLADVHPGAIEVALLPAIRRLAASGNHHWIDRTWFKWNAEYVALFSEAQIDELLALAEPLDRLGTHGEWLAAAIAGRWPGKVLAWLGRRIERQREREWGERYEAVPFSFHRLNAALENHGTAVVETARSSYSPDDVSFRYTGGRLINQVFKDASRIEDELRPFASGTDDDRRFLLEVLAAYDGSPTIDSLCRDLVAATEPESMTWTSVEMAIDSTGVVSGDFGMVEAYLGKKAALTEWLKDDRPNVRQFAEGHILDLDRQIAADRRRSMEELHLRKRQYGEA